MTDHDLPALVLSTLAKATSDKPMARPDILRGVRAGRAAITPDLIDDALADLLASAQVCHCRITRGADTAQDVYWPTGLTPRLAIRRHIILNNRATDAPARQESTRMSKPSNTERLRQIIAAQGPITGPMLAGHGKIAQRDLHALLAGPIKRGQVVARMGYSREHGREIRHYMTPDQAQTWDEGEQAYEALKQDVAGESDPETQHSGAEIQVNEIDPAELMADLEALTAERDGLLGLIGAKDHPEAIDMVDAVRAEMHRLKNDVAAAHLVLGQIAERLKVEAHDQIPSALDELMRAVVAHGRLALLVIDSADLTEIEPLDTADPAEATRRAVDVVDRGEAARAVVIRVLGEARRQVQWLDGGAL